MKGTRLTPFGAAEHPTDKSLKQLDRLIREVGDEVEADGKQCPLPALTVVAGKVLDRHTPGFANELRHAGLMDGMAARRLDPDGADMLQALDQAQHRGGLGCLLHLPQPSQIALTIIIATMREGIEAATLLRRQTVGQSTMYLTTRLVAGITAQTFKHHRRWQDDPALETLQMICEFDLSELASVEPPRGFGRD